jgi:hypothetical protein
MKRRFGARFVFVLRVAAGAWLGGALAMAAVTLAGEVARPKLLVIFMMVVTAFWVLMAVVISVAHALHAPATPARAVSTPLVPSPTPAFENQSRQPESTWYAAAERDNASRPTRSSGRQARRVEAMPRTPDPPPRMISIPVRPHREGGNGTREMATGRPTALILQCPRCGDFGVSAHAQQPHFEFDCQQCGHSWSWTDGTPWPTTLVMPRLALAQFGGRSTTTSERSQVAHRTPADY